MKRFATLFAIVAVAASAITGVSSATSYHWPSSEKWAFEDSMASMATKHGATYPNLYADCLQKAAQHTFRSYGAWINASDGVFNRWNNSAAVTHCIVAYTM